MNTHRLTVLIAVLFTTAARIAGADDDHGARYRLAMRAISVRDALSEMVDDSYRQTDLFLSESHVTPPPAARAANDAWEDIRVPVGVQGQDLVFNEQFVMAGREDDFEDAADKWMARKIKGSDAAAAARGHLAISPRFAWNGGPLVGVNRGRFSVMAGEDHLRAKWTQPMARPGWFTRISAGTDDGEDSVSFTVGRSLLRASRPR